MPHITLAVCIPLESRGQKRNSVVSLCSAKAVESIRHRYRRLLPWRNPSYAPILYMFTQSMTLYLCVGKYMQETNEPLSARSNTLPSNKGGLSK